MSPGGAGLVTLGGIMSIDSMLKGHELFRALSVEGVDAISRLSGVKALEHDELLFKSGAKATHLFVNLEGLLQLELPTEHGVNAVICKVTQGELFGLSSLLGSAHYTTTARVVDRANVLAIESEPFRAILHDNPALGLNVMSRVAQVYFERYVGVMHRLQGAMNQML